MHESQTYAARWVFPVTGPPLPGGTVTVRGDRIEAVSPNGERTPDLDLGNVALIPGLVNAHTHLDLTGARGLIPPTDPDHFTDWLRGVIAFRRSQAPEAIQPAIRAGLAECLLAGTTLIGDITPSGTSYQTVVDIPVRAVLFWEIIGLTAERFNASLELLITRAGLSWDDDALPAITPTTQFCRWAVSPHAPYSAHHDSARSQLMLGAAIHLAESPAELELLATRTGPFVPFLQQLGVWEPSSLTAKLSDFLITLPGSTRPRLLIHCNYLPADSPLSPTHTVVYCPRTHAAFGHPPHPFREFLARGVRVCLGTDSLASNPDLDIFAEAQFLHERYPDFPPEQLLRMVTLSGAEALGWANETGSLEPGKSADFVALPLPDRKSSDPHDLLFASTSERRTLFRGEWRSNPI